MGALTIFLVSVRKSSLVHPNVIGATLPCCKFHSSLMEQGYPVPYYRSVPIRCNDQPPFDASEFLGCMNSMFDGVKCVQTPDTSRHVKITKNHYTVGTSHKTMDGHVLR